MTPEDLHRMVFDELGGNGDQAAYDAELLRIIAPYLHTHKPQGGFMKKIMMVAVMAVLLLVGGCAALQTAQDIACNPPQAVIDVANAAAPLVAQVVNIAIPGSAAYVTAVSVQGAITAIQAGTCVTLTQINAVIAWLQSDEAKTLQMKAMAKAGPARAKTINVQPLVDWRDAQFKQ